MKKMISSIAVLLLAGAFYAQESIVYEADLTAGPEKLSALKKEMRNIEILPAGKNGGILCAEPGRYSAFQIPYRPKMNTGKGSFTLTVAPVSGMDFFKDGKQVKSMTLMEIVWKDKRWGVSSVIAPNYQILTVKLENKSANLKIGSWKKQESHTVSFLWNGRKNTVQLDGKTVLETESASPLTPPMFLTACGYNNSIFAIKKIAIRE